MQTCKIQYQNWNLSRKSRGCDLWTVIKHNLRELCFSEMSAFAAFHMFPQGRLAYFCIYSLSFHVAMAASPHRSASVTFWVDVTGWKVYSAFSRKTNKHIFLPFRGSECFLFFFHIEKRLRKKKKCFAIRSLNIRCRRLFCLWLHSIKFDFWLFLALQLFFLLHISLRFFVLLF